MELHCVTPKIIWTNWSFEKQAVIIYTFFFGLKWFGFFSSFEGISFHDWEGRMKQADVSSQVIFELEKSWISKNIGTFKFGSVYHNWTCHFEVNFCSQPFSWSRLRGWFGEQSTVQAASINFQHRLVDLFQWATNDTIVKKNIITINISHILTVYYQQYINIY